MELYKQANNADAYETIGNVEAHFDQSLPLKRVVIANDPNPDAAGYIKDAYYNLFIKAMRVPVGRAAATAAAMNAPSGIAVNAAGNVYVNRNIIGAVTDAARPLRLGGASRSPSEDGTKRA